MRLFRTVALCGMLLACTTGQAQTDAATAEQLLRASGWWEQLGAWATTLPAAFVQGAQQARKRPSDAETARIRQRAEQAFAADQLQRAATRVVADGVEPGHIQQVLDWYTSGTGQALRTAEVAAAVNNLGVSLQIRLRLGHEQWAQLPPARRQLLTDLILSAHLVEAMLRITENSLLATQRGLALADSDATMPSAEQMRRSFLEQRPALLKTFTEVAQASLALTYRTVPDQVLQDYLDYCKSPAGQHFNELSTRALDQALSDAYTALVQSLPGALDNKNL